MSIVEMSVVEYIKKSKEELKYISWPTKKQTITFTALVILISILVSVYLGLFDFVFVNALKDILINF